MNIDKQDLISRLDEWVLEQRYQEYSENTLKQYRANVMKFIEWLPDNDEPITKDTTLAYKNYLGTMAGSSNSLNTWIVTINKYLKWLGSGDLAIINDDGDFIFHGRKDFQIKHMGQRIELGEIESVCSSLKSIKECCCLYDNNKKKIILFYTTYEKDVLVADIKDELKKYLPSYMIPNKFILLETMPKNHNGKINRSQLKADYSL